MDAARPAAGEAAARLRDLHLSGGEHLAQGALQFLLRGGPDRRRKDLKGVSSLANIAKYPNHQLMTSRKRF